MSTLVGFGARSPPCLRSRSAKTSAAAFSPVTRACTHKSGDERTVRLIPSRTLVGPDVVQIEFVIDAHAHDMVRDAGIEVDSKRCRIRWQARGGRNLTEVQVKVFDLAGPIAAQANLGAGAERPAGLCCMAGELGGDRVDAGRYEGDVDGDVDRGVDGDVDRDLVVIVAATTADARDDGMLDGMDDARRDALSDSEARTTDGAGSLNPADGETPCCIDHKVRRESSAKTRAQCSEPFQSLRHACGHWCVEAKGAGRRIAGRAGAIEGRCLPPLMSLLGVPFDTRDPRARLPVEAGLPTENHAFECGAGGGREERRPRCGIAEHCGGTGLAPAVADVDAEIEPGPGPCWERPCLVERRSLQALRRVVDRSERIELIIEPHPHDAFRDVGIEVDRERCQVCWQARGCRNLTEVQVKVFDLAGPIAAQANLGAGADRPADLCRMAGEASADRVDAGADRGGADGTGVVIVIVVATVTDAWGDLFRDDWGAGWRDALGETATRTGDGAGGLDPADGKTPCGID